MKEVSLLEMIGRSMAKVAAGAGIAALLIWLSYVMLDFGHMQSGFTLPQSLPRRGSQSRQNQDVVIAAR